jgi:hypothetical protein
MKIHVPRLFLCFLTLVPCLPVQQRFYPDGSVHTDDVPCGGQGSACCTFGKVCESNFLCDRVIEQRNYNDEVFVRHSCSDKTLCSEDLGGVLTGPVNPSGDTAILACDDGSYCCQPLLLSPSCCIANPPPDEFILDGNPTAETTIGSPMNSEGAADTIIIFVHTTWVRASVSSVLSSIYSTDEETTSTTSYEYATQIQAPT